MLRFKYRLPVAFGVISDPRWGISDLFLSCPLVSPFSSGRPGQALSLSRSRCLAASLPPPVLRLRPWLPAWPGKLGGGSGGGGGAAPLALRARNLEMMGRSCRSSCPTSLSLHPLLSCSFTAIGLFFSFFLPLQRTSRPPLSSLHLVSLAPVLALFSRSSLHTFNRSRAFSEPQSCLAAEAA